MNMRKKTPAVSSRRISIEYKPALTIHKPFHVPSLALRFPRNEVQSIRKWVVKGQLIARSIYWYHLVSLDSSSQLIRDTPLRNDGFCIGGNNQSLAIPRIWKNGDRALNNLSTLIFLRHFRQHRTCSGVVDLNHPCRTICGCTVAKYRRDFYFPEAQVRQRINAVREGNVQRQVSAG